MWTTSLPPAAGSATVPVDLGASWMHGAHNNPIHDLAKGNGVPLAKTDYENSWMYGRKGGVSDSFEEAVEDCWEKVEEHVEKGVRKLKGRADVPLRTVLDEAMTASRINPAGDGPKDGASVHFSTTVNITHEFGAGPEHLSAAGYDEGEDLKGNDYVFPQGYGRIVDLLAQQLPPPPQCRILLSSPVLSIEAPSNGGQGLMTVRTSTGAILQARAVILTAPLGILKGSVVPSYPGAATMAFHPPLPPPLSASISRLGMGLLDKFVLQFPRSALGVIPKKPDIFQYFHPDETTDWPQGILLQGPAPWNAYRSWPEMLNWQRYSADTPVLIAFSAGADADRLTHLPDEIVKAALMAQLRRMFPGLPEPIAFLRSRWRLDPFTVGSYSYMGLGATEEDREVLARPIGGAYDERLVLAGEHTSVDYPATVQGAFLSGKRAASQVRGRAKA